MSIQVDSTISKDSLIALHHGDLDAIRVAGFYPAELCRVITQKLIDSPLYTVNDKLTLANRIGQSFFLGYESPEIKERYWANAVRLAQDIRRLCEPYLTPIDKLRVQLDELWPAGAMLASIEGRKMYAGVVRVIKQGGSSEPHQDTLPWHVRDCPVAQSFVGQLSANTYLSMPSQGGELQLWRLTLDEEQSAQLETKGSYGLKGDALPPPDYEILPENGELILINTRRVHAVKECHGAQRVSWSNFIGFAGSDNPLLLWS